MDCCMLTLLLAGSMALILPLTFNWGKVHGYLKRIDEEGGE